MASDSGVQTQHFSDSSASGRSADQPVTSASNVPVTTDQQEQIMEIQQTVFGMVAQNSPYTEVLDRLCQMAEKLLPNSVASIMLLNKDTGNMNVLSAPSVPTEGHQALNGLVPSPKAGSCGTAVYHNKAVYVTDTYTDERWSEMRDIAYNFNLCSCWSVPVKDAEGQAIGSFALSSFEHRKPSAFHKRVLGISSDIVSIVLSRQKQISAYKKQKKRLQLLGIAIENASEGMVITDADNRIVEVNRYFEQATGYCFDDVEGKNPSHFSSGLQDKSFYQQMWQELSSHDTWSGEIVNRRKDGSLLHQWLSLSIIRNADGKIQNYVAVFNDLSELKRERDKRLRSLGLDSLTGLPNKSALQEALSGCNKKCSLLVLNVNNFSLINSAYGLDFADRLLVAITVQLKVLLPGAQLYRLNADEFAAHYLSEVALDETFKRVRQYFFLNQIKVDDLSFNISFTFGGANGCDDLMRKSLLAIKQAKLAGRGRFHLYSHEGDEVEQNQRLEYMHWNALLYRALNENCLVPYFQGIRDNHSGKIRHYETLIRMHIDDKVYGPFQFLNAAKLSGLLPALTRLMIDRSFEVMSQYDCTFSINITEDDLSQQFLIDYLGKKSTQYGIEPNRVTLEILEGVSSSGKDNNVDQLAELKQLGYKLAIDDFGTEYSNFERILELDVDSIKIDAKYIKNIDRDKTSYEITRAIVFFAQNAGIPVVAEFVHSAAVQEVVESLGINYSQGYLFSEPQCSINPD